MTACPTATARRLPLHEFHARHGAKFGTFGEWEVPLYYTSILDEHEAVRRRAGLFDISHMGKFVVRGRNAAGALNSLLPRDIAGMEQGRALYMPLLNETGGIVDDILVYRAAEDRFIIIVNAAGVSKDVQWFTSRAPHPPLSPAGEREKVRGEFFFEDLTPEKGLLALQGPASEKILEAALGLDFSGLKYYRFLETDFGMIARTGYTGEDGFEIMADLKKLPEIWERLLAVGAHGRAPLLQPIGFGARDTLRLEAGMLLYGHDMNEEVTPLEAGIDWAVDFKKDTFVGREALIRKKNEGLKRKLIGFEMIDRGIPRADYEIQKNGKAAGKVTSGSFAPTFKKNIGLGYIPSADAVAGHEIDIVIREKACKAKIVKLPFYKRKNQKGPGPF